MTYTYETAVQHCASLQKKYGTSYFIATLFFSKEIRQAVQVMYAFFRVPDEYVDTEIDKTVGLKSIDRFMDDWSGAYNTKKSSDPVLFATAVVCHRYKIPYAYTEVFLKTMKQDISVVTYNKYVDVEKYMYGSAAVVGLILTHILGYTSTQAMQYATHLGYAMQLTNFLRDIREDVDLRGRVYIAEEELQIYNLNRKDIEQHIYNDAFVSLMRFQVSRARVLYTEARKGIPMLATGRFAVLLSSYLYEAILDEIEKIDYNVYTGRVHVPTYKKIYIICTTYVRYICA